MRIPWRKAKPLGRRGEDIAVKALKRAGYQILERNLQLGRYEIDVVAREGDTVAFVEVKTRSSDAIARPEDNVHAEKQRRLILAGRMYESNQTEEGLYYRFDVVSVLIQDGKRPDVSIMKNAFQPR